MAKVYSFERFKIKRRIKFLETELQRKTQESQPGGFFWFNHYAALNIHKEIFLLNEQLSSMTDDVSTTENKKDKEP